MIDEIESLEREWSETNQEVKRLRLVMVDAWRGNNPDTLHQLRFEQLSASSRLTAINTRLREIVETSDIALTASQVLAACNLLGWTIKTLADRSKITVPTLERAARDGTGHMLPIKMVAVRRTFEEAGIQFTNKKTPGARLRKAKP